MMFVIVKTQAEIKKTLSYSKPPKILNLENLFELYRSTKKLKIVAVNEAKIIPATPKSSLIDINTSIKYDADKTISDKDIHLKSSYTLKTILHHF